MAPESTALTTRVQSGSPYQLDQFQLHKASTALLAHISTKAAQAASSSSKKTFLTSSSPSPNDAELIWLVLTTKHHITPHTRLKPGKIPLPHPLNTSPDSTLCLIVPDPQRTFKDVIAHPSFPLELGKRITRVIGISKLKAKYKSFESKRQLRDEHDFFLADKRVITLLPNFLGKTFYTGGAKRPIPITLEGYKPKKDEAGKRFSVVVKKKPEAEDSKSVASPAQCAKEIERALGCALIHLSPAATTSVKVGLSTFIAKQVSENVEAVVNGMVEKFIAKGWRNVKAIHIKGANTMALPVWLADELWVDEGAVLEAEEVEERQLAAIERKKGKKGRKMLEGGKEGGEGGRKRKLEDTDFSLVMKERREKLRAQKRELRGAVAGAGREEKAEKRELRGTVAGVGREEKAEKGVGGISKAENKTSRNSNSENRADSHNKPAGSSRREKAKRRKVEAVA